MAKRDEQKEQRKKNILFNALDLFVRNGYAATKISDIAHEVGMSVGLLFHYFESKEKLYEELVKIGVEGTRYPMQRKIANPLDFFEGFLTELFTYAKENPWTGQMFVLMAQAQRNSSVPESVRALVSNLDTAEYSVSFVEAGQKDGLIRQGDPRLLAKIFWASVQGIMEEYATHPDMPLPPVEWVTDILRAKSDSGKST